MTLRNKLTFLLLGATSILAISRLNLFIAFDSSQSNRVLHVANQSVPVLYALTNDEGLSRQKGTLSCLLELSRQAGRKLVILPFYSHHFGEHPIRLDDYIDSNGGEWRTVNENDDVGVLQGDFAGNVCVLGQLNKNRALFWSVVANGKTVLPVPTFVPEDLYLPVAEERPNTRTIAQTINEKFFDNRHACVISQQNPQCSVKSSVKSFLLEPSARVKDLVREGLGKIYGNADVPYRAFHLRRGNRCEERRHGPIRCGSAANLPFLSLCQGDPNKSGPDSTPLYVATDETDKDFLRLLTDAGCVLFGDTGIQDNQGGALAYSVDSWIFKTATESLTFGCSSLGTEASSYRSHHGLAPILMYNNHTGLFEQVTKPKRKVFETACGV